jgi:hypothetical protein
MSTETKNLWLPNLKPGDRVLYQEDGWISWYKGTVKALDNADVIIKGDDGDISEVPRNPECICRIETLEPGTPVINN